MNANTLDVWVNTWQAEVDGLEPSDTEMFGAGSA